MNKFLKYLVFSQILIFSSLYAQVKSSASIEIRLKVVKHISVEISESDGQSNKDSENSSILSSKIIPNREVIVNLANNQAIENNKVSSLKNVRIFNDDQLLGQISSQQQILLEKSLKSNKLQFLYPSNYKENSSILEPEITIVY